MIELRHLRYFLAVSEELHFRRAAERLKMAQPPLSQAIRQLESELGVTLFDRTTRVVTHTPPGLVFAEHARKVLESLDLAIAETRRTADIGRPVRLGFTPHLPIEHLLHFLNALRERDATIRVDVTHLVGLEQVKLLRAGELDFGILAWPNDEADLDREPVFAGEPLAAFLASEHPLAAKKLLGPADLEDEARVNFPREINPTLADWIHLQTEVAGYRFTGVHETAREARDWIVAVAAGVGVALLPRRFKEVTDAGALVTRRPLDPPLTMPDTVLAWRNDRPAELQPLISTMRQVARELRAIETP
jgi:DNA-binding transcriptional LysR family regulator